MALLLLLSDHRLWKAEHAAGWDELFLSGKELCSVCVHDLWHGCEVGFGNVNPRHGLCWE